MIHILELAHRLHIVEKKFNNVAENMGTFQHRTGIYKKEANGHSRT